PEVTAMANEPHLPDDLENISRHGDQNVERLLGQAYRPEEPDPAFVLRLEENLLATARELAVRRTPTAPALTTQQLRRRLAWVMSTAAALALIALVWHALYYEPGRRSSAGQPPLLDANYRYAGPEGLTARSLPKQPPPRRLAVGETLQTQSGEQRRGGLTGRAGAVVECKDLLCGWRRPPRVLSA